MQNNALRGCTSFDPTQRIISVNGEGGAWEYLPLEASLAWYHHYLMDRGDYGVIDDSDLIYLPEARLLLCRATVYLNGEVVGKSCAATNHPILNDSRTTIGQQVASTAKVRALENAGFGWADAKMKPDFLSSQESEDYSDDIRSCSYDPIPDMTFISNEEGTPPTPYLEVAYRVRWFHQWLRDNKVSGYIDDSDVEFYPGANLVVAKAKVFINGQVVGVSCATQAYDPNDPQSREINPVTHACTQAKGRALINAGFGVLAGGYDANAPTTPLWNTGETPRPIMPPLYRQDGIGGITGELAGREDLPGTPGSSNQEHRKEDSPTSGEEPAKKPRGRKPSKPKSPAKEPEKETVNTSVQETPPVQHEEPEMSRKDALAVVFPFGANKGKTIGEVLGIDRRAVAYYASERFVNPKYADFKRAAIAALEGGDK